RKCIRLWVGPADERRSWIVLSSPQKQRCHPMRWGRAAAVLRSGGGAAILAQQSAQPGPHRYLSATLAERGIARRGPKLEGAVGPSRVVVLDILLEDASEVAVVQDQKPIQRLAPSGRDPALGDRVGVSLQLQMVLTVRKGSLLPIPSTR